MGLKTAGAQGLGLRVKGLGFQFQVLGFGV